MNAERNSAAAGGFCPRAAAVRNPRAAGYLTMIKRKALWALLAVCCVMAAAPAETEEIDMMLHQMTLREKVGQLFVIRPEVLDVSGAGGYAMLSDDMRAEYEKYPCGGFCLFTLNLVDDEQLRYLTDNLHALGPVRPLIYIDEEGGSVSRIGNHPDFDVPKVPAMGSVAKTGRPEKARQAGLAIGAYLKAFGIDADFAPVADVNTNPLNPIIGDRAFGSRPELAARMVTAFLDGLHEAGVAGCVKHFPGHGDTSTDTHLGYAESKKTWDELKTCEMIPFAAGIQAGAEMVMTAHISLPNVTGSAEPATVSSLILTEKLRGEMGYQGIIVTDALEMGAITREFANVEACVRCLNAGADILLLPLDYQEAFDGVVRAVETGEIPMERIDESVRRVLALKQKLFEAVIP